MEQLFTQEEVHKALHPVRLDDKTVALVPTMGALHDGHLSLIRAAQARADYVVVSVFVNPIQFGPTEDFDAYPRDLPADLDVLDAEGVDAVYTPSVDTMYRPGSTTTVEPGPLGDVLEGLTRPGHFRGVCTVVAKVFTTVRPDLAFFGEKDFQQLAILRRMADDLDMPVRLVGCPIVRESDGLALSSRNVYLSEGERRAATVLSRALATAAAAVRVGERDARALCAMLETTIAEEPLAALDYAAIVDAHTLGELAEVDREARALLAVRIGSTRLIDNAPLVPTPA